MKTLMVAGGSPEQWPLLTDAYDLYVGIDRGCLYLLEQGLPLDYAIGDFDSLNDREKAQVLAAAKKVSTSPAEKDDTDTQLALVKILQDYPIRQLRWI